MLGAYRDTLFKSRKSTYVQRVGIGGAHWFKVNGRGAMIPLLRAAYMNVEEADKIAGEYENDEWMPAGEVFFTTRKTHKSINGIVVYQTQESTGIEFSGRISEIK